MWIYAFIYSKVNDFCIPIKSVGTFQFPYIPPLCLVDTVSIFNITCVEVSCYGLIAFP